MIKKIILIIFMLILIPIVFAERNYTERGDFDNFYQRDFTKFNGALDFDLVTDGTSKNLGNGRLTPLVADLDNDGVEEIIVLDSTTLKVFRGSSLKTNRSISLNASQTHSGLMTFDIDGDGLLEIIIADHSSNEDLLIFNYNATTLALQKHFNLASSSHVTGEMLIKCGATNECIISYGHIITATAGASLVYARAFNSTHLGTETLIRTSGSGYINCFSKVPTMAYVDYDNDGTNEYIFSMIEGGGGVGAEFVKLFYIQNDGDGNITLEQTTSINIGNIVSTASGTSCPTIEGYITNPLVFDFADGLPELETVIGYSVSGTTFKIDSYNKNGVQTPSAPYPEISTADGEIISNLIIADIFDDTDRVDVCVLGFDDADLRIDLLCASAEASGSQHREHIIDFSNGSNLDSIHARDDTLIHSITADQTNKEDEILSTLGILKVAWSDACLILSGCLELIWANPIVNGTVISADIDHVEWEDLIVLTPSNIWYLQDNFVFSGASFSRSIDPCINAGTWKVSDANNDNVTREVIIKMTVTDPDGDSVTARSILYYGKDFNNTAEWSSLTASGGVITNQFNINQTITTGILRMEANDTSNPSDISREDVSFSVGLSGKEQGDCVSVSTVSNESAEAIAEQAFQANNSITNSINDIKNPLGLGGLANSLIWLFIMLFIGFILAYNGFKSSDSNHTTVLATVAIVEVVLFLIGIALGFMNAIYLWLMLIIAVGFIVAKARALVVGE